MKRHAIYTGRRLENGTAIVNVLENGDVLELPLRLDLENKSPTGFEWGYGGSGPAQLALAILAHATRNDRVARRHFQRFKWRVVSNLPKDEWQITIAEVLQTITEISAEARA